MKDMRKIVLPFLLLACGARESTEIILTQNVYVFKSDVTLSYDRDAGIYNSVDEDSKGGIHLAFYNVRDASLMYAYSPAPGKDFKLETVDHIEKLDIGLSAKIMIDKNSDTPNIIYIQRTDFYPNYIATPFYIKWAKKTGGVWTKQKFDSMTAKYLDSAMDSKGNIHIAYIDKDSPRLYYAIVTPDGSYSNELVDTGLGEFSGVPQGGNIDGCVSIAIDILGNPHIAYYDAENGNLKYTKKEKGAWSPPETIKWERVLREPLNFQRSGNNYIAELEHPSDTVRENTIIYAEGEEGNIVVRKILENKPEIWGYERLDRIYIKESEFNPKFNYFISYIRTDTSPEDDGLFCSIGIDNSQMPNIAYQDLTNLRVNLLKKSQKWENSNIDNRTPTGFGVKLAMVPVSQDKKIPFAAYLELARLKIKASYTMSEETPPRWVNLDVIEGENIGLSLSITPLTIFRKIALAYSVVEIDRDTKEEKIGLKVAYIPYPR